MSGSNKDLIRLNTGALDNQLFLMGYSNSWFKYEAWTVISDKVRDVKRKSITDNLSFGGEVSIEFDKVATLLEDVKIDTTISALTPVGTGSYARFVDYLGIALFPNIYVTYASNSVQRYTSNALFCKMMRDSNRKDYRMYDRQLAGRMTASERNTRAKGTQVIRTYVKPYWYKLAGHSVVLTALSNKLKLTLDIAALDNIIQTDYTNGATATIQKVEFIYDVLNVTGPERDEFAEQTFSPEGMAYLFEETHGVLNYKIPAGSTEFKVPLNSLILPWSTGYGFFQKYSDVNTPKGNKTFEYDPADLNKITVAALREGDNADFERLYGIKDSADRYAKKNCSSFFRFPHLFFTVSEVADIKNANFGSFNASQINDFHVSLTFNAPLDVDYAFSIVFFEHNWINHQGGEIQRIFAV